MLGVGIDASTVPIGNFTRSELQARSALEETSGKGEFQRKGAHLSFRIVAALSHAPLPKASAHVIEGTSFLQIPLTASGWARMYQQKVRCAHTHNHQNDAASTQMQVRLVLHKAHRGIAHHTDAMHETCFALQLGGTTSTSPTPAPGRADALLPSL